MQKFLIIQKKIIKYKYKKNNNNSIDLITVQLKNKINLKNWDKRKKNLDLFRHFVSSITASTLQLKKYG